MSSPCKIDVRELVLRDEIEPVTKEEDSTCVLSKYPNIPGSLSTGDASSGLSNPAFVPDVNEKSKDKDVGTHSGSPENECQKEAWGITNGQEVPICSEMRSQNPNQLDAGEPTPILSEQDAWGESEQETYLKQKFRELRESFSFRAQKIKALVARAPTPTPSLTPSELEEYHARPRLQSLIQPFDDHLGDDVWLDEMVKICCCRTKRRYIPTFPKVLDPQSKLYISWLLMVTLCYLYNAWAIFMRSAFPYQTADNLYVFFSFDYFSDITYFVDIFIFKVRVQYLHDGFWVDDPVMTRKNYLMKSMFKMDLLSLLPLDLLYLKYGPNSLLRMPRILKIQTFWEFFNRVDAVAKSPYVIRILRTFIYMMYLIHLNACAYYAMSFWEGIGSNSWVFNGTGNAYIRCIYFATKTATSIGKNPKPENEYEYAFMTVSWLMGVFIFAFLIGQIRDIVATATQSKTQYRQRMDQTVQYMRNLGLPDDLQRRVRLWLNHTWEQQKTLDEAMILDSLPRKMKTDVAINVHYNTLVKVQLFKDCDKALLRDLVLKLKPVLFLPGDFVCMKGEVGKEMYIVNKGLVQVMGEDGTTVLATLSEGSVFGEVSLLGIQGCKRRTADVRSKGFSNLFVLSKSDLWDALKNYPEAQTLLKKKAKGLIRQNEALKRQKLSTMLSAEEIIKDLSSKHDKTPKFVKTVMQVLPDDSECGKVLHGKVGSTNKNESALDIDLDTTEQQSKQQPGIQKTKKPKNKIKPNSAPPMNKFNKKTESSPDEMPNNKKAKDASIESRIVPTKKQIKEFPIQTDKQSSKKQTEGDPAHSAAKPNKQMKDIPAKNIPKELNSKSNEIDDVTIHVNKDQFAEDNEITFTQLSGNTSSKELTDKNLTIVLNKQAKEYPNKVSTTKTLIQPLNIASSNTEVENSAISKQTNATIPNEVCQVAGKGQITPEQSEKFNTEPSSTIKLYTGAISTESSPSTETETTGTEESKKVAQDASEFLNSIMQLIPANRQSLRLKRRPQTCAGNSNIHQSQDMSDKDSESTMSVLSLSSLFRTSSDGISESESNITPNELSVQPSTSVSSLIGYDNFAFSTHDMSGSRKSSIFSNETSC